MLLDAAAGEDVHPATGGEAPGDRADRGGRNAGDGLDALGPPAGDAAAKTVEAVCPVGEVRGIRESLGDHHVREAQEEREVGAGGRLQVEAAPLVREPRGRRAPWIDHDQSAGVLSSGEVADEGRHGLGDVRAEQQDGGCRVEIAQRERQPAVDAERAVAGRGGGGHAEPAVVVDRLVPSASRANLPSW